MNGIDVSHDQGTIDWITVAGSGISFAFAKATEGTGFTDPQFATNWSGMKAAGVFRGAYHFFHPAMDAATQATRFHAALAFANGGSSTLNPGDLPAVIDLEWVKDAMPAPAQYAADVLTFLEVIEAATGRPPIIYTTAAFWDEFVSPSASPAPVDVMNKFPSAFGEAFSRYPLWVAEYGVAAPKLPTGWQQYTFWQNSEQGHTAGIGTPVDLDVFNGTLAELQVLAGQVLG
jgi:lysozyme